MQPLHMGVGNSRCLQFTMVIPHPLCQQRCPTSSRANWQLSCPQTVLQIANNYAPWTNRSGDHCPNCQLLRRMPFALSATVDEMVGETLEQGIVEEGWESEVLCGPEVRTNFLYPNGVTTPVHQSAMQTHQSTGIQSPSAHAADQV